MRIDDAIRECVLFVGRVMRKGSQDETRLTGTAFVVRVPSPCGRMGFFYMVTARHVADSLSSGGEWFVRFNTKDGGCDEARRGEETKWWTHPDPQEALSVDAAVAPLALPGTARQGAIPVSLFATDEAVKKAAIGAGSDVFITGLFTKMTGRKKNIPLMRMANIAMMTDEKTPNIKIGKWSGESEVYLLETRSLGGLSGSPAFVIETLEVPVHESASGRVVNMYVPGALFFLGLMHGHWLIKEKDANEAEIQSTGDVKDSTATGLSVCVPAKKILEVLNHPDLVEFRRAASAARLAEEGTTTQNDTDLPS